MRRVRSLANTVSDKQGTHDRWGMFAAVGYVARDDDGGDGLGTAAAWRRVRGCLGQLSVHNRRRRDTGRENMPRVDCSSGVGNTAHQCPSLKRHRSTNGADFGNKGGNAWLTTGQLGTARRLPNDTSW